MFRRIINSVVQTGLESAVQVTTETATSATSRSLDRVFEVTLPTTVYLRASHCDVTVTRAAGNQVEVSATLRASFGWELAAEQDSAGVYLVAKRRPVVGAISTAHFTLCVPPEANLVFNLTPGSVHFLGFEGKLTVPAEVGETAEAKPPKGVK